MQTFWRGRIIETAAKYGELAPTATTCCNACRTCVQTNLLTTALAGVAAAGGVHRASLPPSHRTFLEEARVRFRLGSGTEVGAAERGDRAAAGRPLDEAELQEVRLVHVLDRVRLLAERRR